MGMERQTLELLIGGYNHFESSLYIVSVDEFLCQKPMLTAEGFVDKMQHNDFSFSEPNVFVCA